MDILQANESPPKATIGPSEDVLSADVEEVLEHNAQGILWHSDHQAMYYERFPIRSQSHGDVGGVLRS